MTVSRSAAAVRTWLPPVLIAVAIFFFSATPDLTVSSTAWLDLIVRKAAHVFVFALLGFSVYRALDLTTNQKRKMHWAVALSCLYAATDEYHQLFVAGRHGSLVDFGFDAVGVVCGVVAWYRLFRHTKSGAGGAAAVDR